MFVTRKMDSRQRKALAHMQRAQELMAQQQDLGFGMFWKKPKKGTKSEGDTTKTENKQSEGAGKSEAPVGQATYKQDEQLKDVQSKMSKCVDDLKACNRDKVNKDKTYDSLLKTFNDINEKKANDEEIINAYKKKLKLVSDFVKENPNDESKKLHQALDNVEEEQKKAQDALKNQKADTETFMNMTPDQRLKQEKSKA